MIGLKNKIAFCISDLNYISSWSANVGFLFYLTTAVTSCHYSTMHVNTCLRGLC